MMNAKEHNLIMVYRFGFIDFKTFLKLWRLLIITLVFLTMACGKSNYSPQLTMANLNTPTSLIGVWTYTNGLETDTLTVEPYLGALSSYCNDSMVFTQPDNLGNTVLTIQTQPSQSSCLPLGSHNCMISVSSNQLTLNCGSIAVYTKQ